jgi:hypothetical protein
MGLIARLFGSRTVEAIVGPRRVFGTDSECLDDGPGEVAAFARSVAAIVSECVQLEQVESREWSLGFVAGGQQWQATFEPRDYGAIIHLVNEALHHARAPRRVHVVSSRRGGQDFRLACATPAEVATLLSSEWIVEPALPSEPFELKYDGLRFFGHEHFRVNVEGKVIDAVLAVDQTVQGLPCAGGRDVSFDETGRLSLATLAAATTLGRHTFSQGTQVMFREGTLLPEEVVLAAEQRFDGVTCGAGTTVVLDADGRVSEAFGEE